MSFLFIHSAIDGDWNRVLVLCFLVALCFFLSFMACMLDLVTGIRKTKVLGEKPQSKKFRKSIAKVSGYWSFIFGALFMDVLLSAMTWYYLPFISLLTAVGSIANEILSMRENHKAMKTRASNLLEVAAELAKCTDPTKIAETIKKVVAETTLIDKKQDNG